MKHIILISLLTVIVINFTGLAAIAQQDRNLYVISDIVVKPSMATKFEANYKDWMVWSKNLNLPFIGQLNMYRTSDFHYYYVLGPYTDLANYEKTKEANNNMFAKNFTEEQWKKFRAFSKRHLSSFEYEIYSLWNLMPDLSYRPENPRLKPGERNFMRWIFCSMPPTPDSAEKFEEVCRDWAAFYKSKNIPDGYNIYKGGWGTEVLTYVLVAYGAKSATDFHTEYQKYWTTWSEEHMALWERLKSACRKIEVRDGVYLPDLSYTQEK